MGRKLMRVPLDFDWPLNEVWPGYLMTNLCSTMSESRDAQKYDHDGQCERCIKFAKMVGWKINKDYKCPMEPVYDPPKGEGYQLWETTSEGSPTSPVFKTLDELATWCEDNATVFASFKASKEEWIKMIKKDQIVHKEKHGNTCFIMGI